MPFLHWERSLACFHAARILADAEQMKQLDPKPSFNTIGKLPCSDEERMLRLCHAEDITFHIRRTLDQYGFPTLDTAARDRGQVVERFSRSQADEKWATNRMLMVDQLWLWVLDDRE